MGLMERKGRDPSWSLKHLSAALVVLALLMTSSCARDLQEKIDDLEETVSLLTKQVMMQQLEFEEKIRTDGQSGIKQTRVVPGGTRPYFSNSHTGDRLAAIHDHSDHIRTIGMGEVAAVLNGVEFRTRHNDFKLRMPSRAKKDFGRMESIPLPEVPPEVLEKKTIPAQIAEMKDWFRAWKNSDYSKRDYRKYFVPVLCYLEGYWKESEKKDTIEEPFDSDRHHIDAHTWHELLQKIQFSSNSGRKDPKENYAFLPTKILGVNKTGPVYAQWNYRIACHPLEHEVPLYGFRVVDDASVRMRRRWTKAQLATSRAARFQLNPFLTRFINRRRWTKFETSNMADYLDALMSEVPGLDNYPADLVDDCFGHVAYDIGSKNKQDPPLNTGYYHRFYKEYVTGAMGTNFRRRSFSDASVFMAMNTRSKIAASTLTMCDNENKPCKEYSQRWSYAIPLEIVYMTPLLRWNPYDLEYKGERNSPRHAEVRLNGRNGGLTPEKAFNGTNSKTFFLTPAEFFGMNRGNKDAADTGTDTVGVLDREGKVRHVVASGTHISLPNIPGVGVLRTRWPVAPVHGEGSGTWKELDAVKDILMRWNTFQDLLPERLKLYCD